MKRCAECGLVITTPKGKTLNRGYDFFCSFDCMETYINRRNAVIKKMLNEHRAEMLARHESTQA